MIVGCLGDPMLRQSPYSLGGASWFESPEPDSRFAPRDRAAAERVGLRPGGRRLPARTLTGAVETELDAKRPDVRIF